MYQWQEIISCLYYPNALLVETKLYNQASEQAIGTQKDNGRYEDRIIHE